MQPKERINQVMTRNQILECYILIKLFGLTALK